jgi:hypothetical protein
MNKEIQREIIGDEKGTEELPSKKMMTTSDITWRRIRQIM